MKSNKVSRAEGKVYLLPVVIISGIVTNVLLAYLAFRIDFPLYVDVAGTILASVLGGLFSGIAVAVFSNIICSIFNSASVYFSVVNAGIAILTSLFIYKGWFKSFLKTIVYIFAVAFLGGVIGGCIQWILFGMPQFEDVLSITNVLSQSLDIDEFIIFLIVNFLLNLADKIISLFIAFIITKLIKPNVRVAILNSGWRQTPLDKEQISALRKQKKIGSVGIGAKMTAILIVTTLILTAAMSFISINLFFNRSKDEHVQIAEGVAEFASSVIDGDKVDEYIKKGEDAAGYTETENLLYQIRDNAPAVEYLYAIRIEETGCRVIFDLDTEDTPSLENGDIIEFESAFEDVIPLLFDGKEIDPIESNDISGWVITVYKPIYNSAGRTVAYACADVYMQNLADYTREFLIKAALIISGILILILAFGLWYTRYSIVYPINSMSYFARRLVYDSENHTELDENIHLLKKMNIQTGDEIDDLYEALCKMTSDTAEQLKDISNQSKMISQMQSGLIVTMADLVENRDYDTGTHIQKTAAYVSIILKGLKKKGYYADRLTKKYMSDVEMSAPLHDVGKINIPDAILNKPDKLTTEEYEIMKSHTIAGKRIMEKAISTLQGQNYLKEARNMAAYHHEKWDGTGYPEGLYGEIIPLSARIMAVADVFDALTSKRVYKDGMPAEKVFAILEKDAGTHFDPKVVEVFIENGDEVKRVMKKYQNL